MQWFPPTYAFFEALQNLLKDSNFFSRKFLIEHQILSDAFEKNIKDMDLYGGAIGGCKKQQK